MNSRISREIQTNGCPHCEVCGSIGDLLYENQQDKLFGAPGYWKYKRCLNSNCGLIWLDPMPIKDDIHKAYFNYYTHKDKAARITLTQRVYQAISEGYLAYFYGFNAHKCPRWKKVAGILLMLFPVRRSEQNLKVMYLNNHKKGRLLEIGCGTGEMLSYFNEMGWEVEGLDFDDEAVRIALTKDIPVSCSTLEDKSYKSNTFDVIVMNHLIEHVVDPTKLLEECYRILKPGGQLLIATPNAESWGHKKFKSNWRGLEPPRHINIFTPSSLFSLAQKAGYKKIKVKTEVRMAASIFLVSNELSNNNCVSFNNNYSIPLKIWAKAYALLEWIRILFDPQSGEEIFVSAIK